MLFNNKYRHIQTYKQMRAHTHTHTHTHTHSSTDIHTHIYIYIYIYIYISKHKLHTRTLMLSHAHAHAHSLTHTYTYTHKHTHNGKPILIFYGKYYINNVRQFKLVRCWPRHLGFWYFSCPNLRIPTDDLTLTYTKPNILMNSWNHEVKRFLPSRASVEGEVWVFVV